jgi:hypothetical protein
VLDLVGIVFSSVMMVYIIFRAVQLDRTRPWFEMSAPEQPPGQEAAPARPVHTRKPRVPGRPGWVRPVPSRGTHR